MTIKFLLFYLIISHSAYSAEADTFTNRFEYLEDSTSLINSKANLAIESSLQKANSKDQTCNEKILYTELRKYFNNHMKGILYKDIESDNLIMKREVKLSESIYKDWTPWDGIGLGVSFLKGSKLTISPIIKIGETSIGLDKFEHMFGQGFYYFTDSYLKDRGPIRAVKNGIIREKTFLGGNKLSNGVFSYGDLAANFNGMRFWTHFLLKHDDILGKDKNLGPYVSCVNDQWVQVKELDFRNYIDDSMDEAINCSKFSSNATALKFTKTIETLGFTCPIDKEKLNKLSVKYQFMSKWMINENGTEAVKYFSEFKSKK
jgi:hypothetical protein